MLSARQINLMERGARAFQAFLAGVAFCNGLTPDEMVEAGDLLEQHDEALLAEIDAIESEPAPDLPAALAAAKRAGDAALVADLTAAIKRARRQP